MYIWLFELAILGAVMSRGFGYKDNTAERVQFKALVPLKVFQAIKLASACKSMNMADVLEDMVMNNLGDFIKMVEKNEGPDASYKKVMKCQDS